MPAEMKFCDFEIDKIIEILENAFAISNPQLIIEAYSTFKKSYNNSVEVKGKVVAVEKNELTLNNWGKTYDDTYWMGIDLPTLFSPGGIKCDSGFAKTIMIVAEDALRDQNDDFLRPYKSQIIISTPFGLHLPDPKFKQSFYHKLIECAIGKQYAVYATDIKKLWIKGNKRKEELDSSLFSKCLMAEIEFIKPSLIIGFGKFAEGAIEKIKADMKDAGKEVNWKDKSFLHPSGANNRAWKNAIGSCSVCDKLKFVSKELNLIGFSL